MKKSKLKKLSLTCPHGRQIGLEQNGTLMLYYHLIDKEFCDMMNDVATTVDDIDTEFFNRTNSNTSPLSDRVKNALKISKVRIEILFSLLEKAESEAEIIELLLSIKSDGLLPFIYKELTEQFGIDMIYFMVTVDSKIADIAQKYMADSGKGDPPKRKILYLEKLRRRRNELMTANNIHWYDADKQKMKYILQQMVEWHNERHISANRIPEPLVDLAKPQNANRSIVLSNYNLDTGDGGISIRSEFPVRKEVDESCSGKTEKAVYGQGSGKESHDNHDQSPEDICDKTCENCS